MTITTTSLLTAPVQQSFSYKILSVPTPYFIHKVPAMLKMMPANGGRILRQRRYSALPTATVPLGNTGINPPPVPLTAVNIDAVMDFYGQFITLEEQVTLQSQDPVLNEAAQRLGVSLRQTEDELTRNMLQASAAFINATGGTNGDSPTEGTRFDVNEIVKSLVGADAKVVVDNIPGENRFGTGPLRDSFVALGHTDLIGDLENIEGFINKAQYPAPSKSLASEWGSVSNLRYLLSSIGSQTAAASLNGETVYNIFCCALEAFACIEQTAYSAQFIYRPPIFSGPLALTADVGWKMAEVPVITNDAWVINQRVTLALAA